MQLSSFALLAVTALMVTMPSTAEASPAPYYYSCWAYYGSCGCADAPSYYCASNPVSYYSSSTGGATL
jgi:hypothetical protein